MGFFSIYHSFVGRNWNLSSDYLIKNPKKRIKNVLDERWSFYKCLHTARGEIDRENLVPDMDEILSSAISWDEFKNPSVMDRWCANKLNNMFVLAQNSSFKIHLFGKVWSIGNRNDIYFLFLSCRLLGNCYASVLVMVICLVFKENCGKTMCWKTVSRNCI